MALLVFGFMLLNFAISWFNAWSVGKTWAETRAAGGWPHFVNWCAAIMSASGFTWVYVTILTMFGVAIGKLDAESTDAMIQLGYIIIIFPILGSGITLTIHSWAVAWRERSFASVGVAGWNTFAQTYNTVRAISLVPKAFSGVANFVAKGKKDVVWFIVVGTALALVGGVLTTMAIARATMQKHAVAMQQNYNLS